MATKKTETAIETAVEAPALPPAVIRTAEEWARAKGMYPEFVKISAPFARADAAPTNQHNPHFWKFNATKAGSGWPEGKELTEAEFDAAVMKLFPGETGHQYR